MRNDIVDICRTHASDKSHGKENIRSNRHATKSHLNNWNDDTETEDFTSVGRIHSKNGWGDRKEKWFSTKPIRRFLRSRIGKKWDDVYSEICENISNDDAGRELLWEITHWIVDVKCYWEDGVMMTGSYWPEPIKGGYSETFYVHPDTGILCYEQPDKSWKIRKKNYKINYVKNEDNPLIQYHKIKGIWYEISFEFLKGIAAEDNYNNQDFTWVNNLILNQINNEYKYPNTWGSTARICIDLFGSKIIPIKKRQLNSKEIKKIIK